MSQYKAVIYLAFYILLNVPIFAPVPFSHLIQQLKLITFNKREIVKLSVFNLQRQIKVILFYLSFPWTPVKFYIWS